MHRKALCVGDKVLGRWDGETAVPIGKIISISDKMDLFVVSWENGWYSYLSREEAAGLLTHEDFLGMMQYHLPLPE